VSHILCLIIGAVESHHRGQQVEQREAADSEHQSTQLFTGFDMLEFVGDETVAFDVGADADDGNESAGE